MKRKLLFIFALVTIGCSGCTKGNKETPIPLIKSHTSKVVQNYSYNYFAATPGFVKEKDLTSTIHFFNDIKIPYMNVVDYFKENIDLSGYLSDGGGYTYETGNNKIKIVNEGQDENAVIDFDSQTITYSNFVNFLNQAQKNKFPSNIDLGAGSAYFINISDLEYHKPDEYKICLKDYNIPIYFEDGQGYLPLYLFRNIFQMTSLNIQYFNGNNMYNLFSVGDGDETLNSMKVINKEGDQSYLTNGDLLEFNYNLIALTIDHIFGVRERTSRVDGHTIKYNRDGAYKMLEPYKNRLMSTDPNVSNDAMYDLFNNELNDGGHTYYSSLNVFSTEANRKELMGESKHTIDTAERLMKERSKANLSPDQVVKVPEGYYPPDAYYKEVGDVAFITFDSFVPTVGELTADLINDSNYYYDTISLIHYANKQIKKNNIKNVVIDLSCNTGGAVVTSLFASSWLCDKPLKVKSCNIKDHMYSETTLCADVNLDGVYDEGDYLDSSINKFCIVSNASFSSANVMACLLEDNSSVKFIGEQSGGGCCNVVFDLNTAFGATMRMSNMCVSLRKSSTYSNLIDNDNGVIPTFYKISSDEENAKNFYDRETIIKKIHENS